MAEEIKQEQTAPAKPKKQVPKSKQLMAAQTKAYLEGAMRAKQRGEKIAWASSIFPQEICEAMGIYVMYPENHAAGVSARHEADPYLKAAEGECGYNNDICAYAKLNLAYAEALSEGGSIPLPDFLLLTNNICNQLTPWYENLSEKLGISLIMIDCVYNYDDYVMENRVKYMRSQLEDTIVRIQEITGKVFDEEKFTHVMEISARNKDLWYDANEYMKYKPSPLNGFELFNYMGPMVCHRGEESTTKILEALHEEIQEHIKNGTSTFKEEEKYRVYWEGIACWPYLRHTMTTLRDRGINMVATGYGIAWALDYKTNDLDGMARAYAFCPNNNVSLNNLVDRRVSALKRFQCDGMIYHVNRSCKVMDCMQMAIQRQIAKQVDVPFISFDGDQADYRNYSEAQYETRVQGLLEVMQTKKEAKENE